MLCSCYTHTKKPHKETKSNNNNIIITIQGEKKQSSYHSVEQSSDSHDIPFFNNAFYKLEKTKF